MNNIRAVVTNIEGNVQLHRISLDAGGEHFVVITLELADEYSIGADVHITFKSTHVALAKEMSGEVSISNRIPCRVVSVKKSPVLTEVLLDSRAGRFYCLTTTAAAERLDLREGDLVTALMKASDLYLSRVADQADTAGTNTVNKERSHKSQ
ncbi:MAG: TOBE domain-containing protein [Prosthecochloris sp.]|nr:TOBE domain-containing protein [Prosthecochloris sp.]MCW8798567.1 TOBE domain-containing protein [Prosthecochloris sp.]NEX12436.1 transporter [Prosthecochloris sp.]